MSSNCWRLRCKARALTTVSFSLLHPLKYGFKCSYVFVPIIQTWTKRPRPDKTSTVQGPVVWPCKNNRSLTTDLCYTQTHCQILLPGVLCMWGKVNITLNFTSLTWTVHSRRLTQDPECTGIFLWGVSIPTGEEDSVRADTYKLIFRETPKDSLWASTHSSSTAEWFCWPRLLYRPHWSVWCS